MVLTTTSEFVLSAHKVACVEWKRKIEKEFPDLFPSLIEQIRQLPEYQHLENILTGVSLSSILRFEEGEKYIRLGLPHANDEWTFGSWKLAMAICTKFGYGPRHGYDTDRTTITLKRNDL